VQGGEDGAVRVEEVAGGGICELPVEQHQI
jgi:hypothetical protein